MILLEPQWGHVFPGGRLPVVILSEAQDDKSHGCAILPWRHSSPVKKIRKKSDMNTAKRRTL